MVEEGCEAAIHISLEGFVHFSTVQEDFCYLLAIHLFLHVCLISLHVRINPILCGITGVSLCIPRVEQSTKHARLAQCH